jgi:hypothetical protein
MIAVTGPAVGDLALRYTPPRRVVVERVLLATLFLFGAGVVAFAVRVPLLFAPAGALWLWLIVRHVRLMVAIESDGLRVRNPWKSYFVPFAEVAEVVPVITESKTPYLMPGLRRKGHLYAIRLWALGRPTNRLVFKAGEDARRRDLERVVEGWRQRFQVRLHDDWDR